MAMGGDKNNPNVIEVIGIACDECPAGGYEVGEACRGCLAHNCEYVCKFGALTFDEKHVAHIDKSKCVECGQCSRVCPYGAITHRTRPCEKACKIKAIYAGGETKEATVVGTDSRTDLAVLKMEKGTYPYATLGDSSVLEVGELCVAIGNPLGMESSVTSGIISAVNRSVTSEDGTTYNLIQTDAAINSGNSGGALVNAQGKVIGINTLKLSGSGIEGMGFAIPINETIEIYKDLIEHGKVLRPYIGIGGIDLDEASAEYYNLPTGIYIKEIYSNSPAALADLKQGDVVTAIDGTKINSMDELNELKNNKEIGDEITLDVYRNEKTKQIKIKLAEMQ